MKDSVSRSTVVPRGAHDTRAPIASPASQARRPRIAVIGVHGVGDHEPGETAATMASLLLGLDASGRARPLGTAPSPDRRSQPAI